MKLLILLLTTSCSSYSVQTEDWDRRYLKTWSDSGSFFKTQDACNRSRLLYYSAINYDELLEKGETIASLKGKSFLTKESHLRSYADHSRCVKVRMLTW